MTTEPRPTIPHVPNLPAQQMRTLTRTTGSRGAATGSTVALAQRLFTAPERWGWEYVEPRPPAPFPHAAPEWREPMGANLSAYQQALSEARYKLGTRLKIAAGVFLLGLLICAGSGALGTILILAALGVAGFAAYQIYAPHEAMRQAEAAAKARRDAVHAQFLDAQRSWEAAKGQHDAAEHTRVATDPLLFPLAPNASASRVDVVGGTTTGWAALLASMGSSILAEGGSLLVLDLSRRDVTGPLLALAEQVRGEPQRASVPAALEAPWLLGDLEPRRLADVLASAIDSMRRDHDVSLAAMDAEILRTVATRIERPLSFARLAAGIRVLRADYDVDEESLLSPVEVARLTERVDTVGRREKMLDELGLVEAQLDALAASEAGTAGDAGDAQTLWRSRSLAVLRSDTSPKHGLRSVVDRVAFAAVLHRLADGRPDAADPTLVVVGADELGRTALKEMAHTAGRARVRLVYVFEELRDDAEDVLGGAGSVAVLMQLGNGRQAQTAAEFVGHGVTFQVSQLSKQVGNTITNGTNRSTTRTDGGSLTRSESGSTTDSWGGGSSRSWGGGHSGGLFGGSSNWGESRNRTWGGSTTEGWSDSYTESWSTAATHGTSWSEARSDTDGVTVQRSREFTVEPTQVQTLEETAFLLVDSGPQGKQVRMADCFPGTVMVPRRSERPRLEGPR